MMALRRFSIALVTCCLAREYSPPLAAPSITAHNKSNAAVSPVHLGRGLQDLNDFSCDVDISSVVSETGNWRHFFGTVATSNGLVIFAPYDADCVGIFNPTTSAISCVDISSTISTGGKFASAVISNGLVIMPPYNADCVGVFDPISDAFSCIDVSSTITRDQKFESAAATSNGIVVFAPRHANCVGVFNSETNAFSCVPTFIDQSNRFTGAVTVASGHVIMAPRSVNCVGVFDPATNTFSCVDISSTITGGDKFFGATKADNGNVVFTPLDADCVGIFNPTTSTFTCVDISSPLTSGCTGKFHHGTLSNGRIIFPPYCTNCVGSFDPTTNAFSCLDISPVVGNFDGWTGGFVGAVTAADGVVVLTPGSPGPGSANCLGVFNPPSSNQPQDGAVIEMTGDNPKLIFGTLENPTCQLSVDRPNSRLVSTCSIQDSRRLEETFDCEAKYLALEQQYKALRTEVSELRSLAEKLKAVKMD